MFLELQKIWKGDDHDPKDIIDKLDEYSEEYLALCSNRYPDSYDKKVVTKLKDLRSANNPSSTFPFLMKVLKEYKKERLSFSQVVDILDGIESFLVRRALCGIEPTGLLVMFRTLWNTIKHNPTKQELFNVINKRSTIEWPDNEKLINSIQSRSIYSGHIAKYVILQYEKSLNADFPEIADPWIEHILPQKLNQDWAKIFTKEEHEKYVHTWGNLIPLSSQMNQSLSQNIYDVKKSTISKDSMYATGRRLAEDYVIWNEESIKQRNKILADWAILRWKRQ